MSGSITRRSDLKSSRVPRLDFSELDGNENRNIKTSVKRSSAVEKEEDLLKNSTDSICISDLKSTQVKTNRKETTNTKKQLVYKNKQVFYSDVVQEENNKSSSRGQKDKYWYLDEDKPLKVVSPKKITKEEAIDDAATLQTQLVTPSYGGVHQAKKNAAEDEVYKKQQDEVMEQVLIDLLSRHVISDVEQDRDPNRQNPADPTSNFNTAPLRNKSRRLHDTKVSTRGAVTESKLKDRVSFQARVITKDGRDALKDLFGFFFHHDSTLTLYEFRLFGKKKLKALPLIERRRYRHVIGRRKGKYYNEDDFQLGRNLTFKTKNQPRLPDTMKRNEVLLLRVCSGESSYDQLSSMRSCATEDARLEVEDRKVTAKVQCAVREFLVGRSVSVVIGLGKLFRRLDRSGDGKLSKDELLEALKSFNINLNHKDFESVWRVIDENGDGAINYGEFIRAFIGEMNEFRKSLVRKVFKKLDPQKSGSADLMDLKKLYSARSHPLVVQGKITREEMEENFIKALKEIIGSRNSQISFVEFEEYYEGLSLSVADDGVFFNILRNCWGI